MNKEKTAIFDKQLGQAIADGRINDRIDAAFFGANWMQNDCSAEIARLQAEVKLFQSAMQDKSVQIDELVAALREACLQIEYLHGKFMPTGSGETVLSRSEMMLAKYEQ